MKFELFVSFSKKQLSQTTTTTFSSIIEAQLGDYNLLRTLLHKGADPETPTASGSSSFFCQRGPYKHQPLHDKINPKDCQVLFLDKSGFLQFFRGVSSYYGKPCPKVLRFLSLEACHKLNQAMICQACWTWQVTGEGPADKKITLISFRI